MLGSCRLPYAWLFWPLKERILPLDSPVWVPGAEVCSKPFFPSRISPSSFSHPARLLLPYTGLSVISQDRSFCILTPAPSPRLLALPRRHPVHLLSIFFPGASFCPCGCGSSGSPDDVCGQLSYRWLALPALTSSTLTGGIWFSLPRSCHSWTQIHQAVATFLGAVHGPLSPGHLLAMGQHGGPTRHFFTHPFSPALHVRSCDLPSLAYCAHTADFPPFTSSCSSGDRYLVMGDGLALPVS